MDFKSKKLGDLVDEMLQLAVKNPDILIPGCENDSRQLYEEYRNEINKREVDLYNFGGFSEQVFAD